MSQISKIKAGMVMIQLEVIQEKPMMKEVKKVTLKVTHFMI